MSLGSLCVELLTLVACSVANSAITVSFGFGAWYEILYVSTLAAFFGTVVVSAIALWCQGTKNSSARSAREVAESSSWKDLLVSTLWYRLRRPHSTD